MSVIDPKVEIEFTAGVWTDVSPDVDLAAGIAIAYGRTSEFSTASVASCTFQLANHLGKYTPFSQLLADGVTVHPFYPNVIPRRRVRVTHTGGSDFFGYINAWPPALENGARAYVPISATDRQNQEAKFTAQPAHIATMLVDTPFALWTNTAAAGATTSYDVVNGQPLRLDTSNVLVKATFGAANPCPLSEGTTGVGGTVVPSGQSRIFFVPLASAARPALTATKWSVEFWAGLNSPVSGIGSQIEFDIDDDNGLGFGLSLGDLKDGGAATGSLSYFSATNTIHFAFQSTANDSTKHHYAVTAFDNGTNLTVRLYIDGVQVGVGTGATGDGGLPAMGALTISGFTSTDTGFTNVYGPIALYASTLTAARVARHAQIGIGAPSLTTGQRVTEYYSWAGVPAAEMTIDAGKATVSSHPTGGKTLPTILAEMATTEGGGAAAYRLPNGNARFCDRTFRTPGAPLATLDVSKDIIGQPFAPSVDDLNLITTSTVTRGSVDQTYTDTVSQALNGITGDTATSFADNDADAANLAASRVVGQSRPRLRLPQFAVDLFTAETAGLAAALAGVQIGSRIRLTNLPVGVASRSTLDVLVEGWSLNVTKTQWLYTFDATPADNPARGVWDDPTYGRWGPGTTMTLTAGVTAAATSISVTTTAGNPTFSTVAGSYPLKILVNEEEMTITAAPGSSASPQTLTVTRGTSGTRAAPQSAGALVTLSPAATWTL